MAIGVDYSSNLILVSMVNWREKLFLVMLGTISTSLGELEPLSESPSSKTSYLSLIVLVYNSSKVLHLIIGFASTLAKMTIDVGLPESCLNKSWYCRASTW